MYHVRTIHADFSRDELAALHESRVREPESSTRSFIDWQFLERNTAGIRMNVRMGHGDYLQTK